MLDWIARELPGWTRPWIEALRHPRVQLAVAAASVLMFVASVVGVPWFIVRLPPDYFTDRAHERARTSRRSPLSWAAVLVKNLAGLMLFVMGVAMLFLPGQGMLAIVTSLLIMDFPGKRRLERRVVASPRIFAAVNALRMRAGRDPFERWSHAG